MNYTLESFIDYCDDMKIITQEGLLDKVKDYIDRENARICASRGGVTRKPVQITQGESKRRNWWESLWSDLDGMYASQYDKFLQAIKKCNLDTFGCLFTVLRTKGVTKQQFNNIAKKYLKNPEYIKYTSYCLMDYDFGDIDPHAKEVAKDLQLTVVDLDGFGNSLLYSIKNGEFYDFNHEASTGENIDEWISRGVKYEVAVRIEDSYTQDKGFMTKIENKSSFKPQYNLNSNALWGVPVIFRAPGSLSENDMKYYSSDLKLFLGKINKSTEKEIDKIIASYADYDEMNPSNPSAFIKLAKSINSTLFISTRGNTFGAELWINNPVSSNGLNFCGGHTLIVRIEDANGRLKITSNELAG